MSVGSHVELDAARCPRRLFVCYEYLVDAALLASIDAVARELEATEREYALMPFFVRPMVRRGFAKRTGRDFAAWRALLADARRGERTRELEVALVALAEHYRGAPARAKRGMGATAEQLVLVEQRSRARAEAVEALRRRLLPPAP